MRARNVAVDGQVFSLIPAADAADLARICELAIERLPPNAPPISARFANVVSVMRCARLASSEPLEDMTSATGSCRDAVCQDAAMTAHDIAERSGTTARNITALCARGGAPFPGARKSGRVWLIPASEANAYIDQREQEAA